MFRLARRQVLQGLTFTGLAASFGARLSALAGAITGTVVAVVNTATAKKPEGAEEPVAQGTAIAAGDTVATANKSAMLIQLADGSQFTIGARSSAVIGPAEGEEIIKMGDGSFRFRSAAPNGGGHRIATSALMITLKGTELIVRARDNLTVCGVISGVITCTSIKTGTSVDVSAGQSVAWGSGSFGQGVTEGIATTEDPAVDRGIDAAQELWDPAPPPPAPKPEGIPPVAPPVPMPQ